MKHKQAFFNQQNQPLTRTSFGKSIKNKAHVVPPQRLNLQQISQNKQNTTIQYYQPSSPTDFSQTPSLIIESQLSFKNKTVKFDDESDPDDSILASNLSQSSRCRKNHSILKKNSILDKLNTSSCNSDAGSLDCLSAKLSVKDQGYGCSNDKYDKMLKTLKSQNKKFFDDMFPPGGSSLCYSKIKIKQFEQVRWMRLQNVFKGKKLVLYHQNLFKKCMITPGYFMQYTRNMSIAYNALSNSNRCLERIFEDQKLLGLCIYYLRINQDGIWKYSIIDDHIPVIINEKQIIPAFLNVLENQQGEIQIWPYLLQKAFAKINNCYECLFQDTIQNMLYELTGYIGQQINLQNGQSEHLSHMTGEFVAILKQPKYRYYFNEQVYALREQKSQISNSFLNFDLKIKLINPIKRLNIIMNHQDLKKEFNKIYIHKIEDRHYSLGCIIKQTLNSISLRKFTVKTHHKCVLSLIQKDQKFYRNNGYQYVWTRLLIVAKDGKNGYRWINGKYDNKKIISLQCYLAPGDYYAVATGDWKNRVYQMNLHYQGSEQIKFQRDVLASHPNLLIETCVDLAQRFGRFKQLSKNICCYRLIDKRNGFIIDNINNQLTRPIYFQKQYKHIGNFSQIIDRQKMSFIEGEQNWIETKIDSQSHFTLGIRLTEADLLYIDQFSFD